MPNPALLSLRIFLPSPDSRSQVLAPSPSPTPKDWDASDEVRNPATSIPLFPRTGNDCSLDSAVQRKRHPAARRQKTEQSRTRTVNCLAHSLPQNPSLFSSSLLTLRRRWSSSQA